VVSRAYSSKSCPFVLAEELNGLILEIGDHAGQSATKREAHARVGYISTGAGEPRFVHPSLAN
jgi:hypothetical protein